VCKQLQLSIKGYRSTYVEPKEPSPTSCLGKETTDDVTKGRSSDTRKRKHRRSVSTLLDIKQVIDDTASVREWHTTSQPREESEDDDTGEVGSEGDWDLEYHEEEPGTQRAISTTP
jgi:hypothetical protein